MNLLMRREFAKDKFPELFGRELWNNLSDAEQDRIISIWTEFSGEEISRVEAALGRMAQRQEQFTVFLIGIVLGLGGGILANAVTLSLGVSVGLWIVGSSILLIALWWMVYFVRSQNHQTVAGNKLLASFAQQIMVESKSTKDHDGYESQKGA